MCPVTATSPWAAAPPPLPRRTTIIRILTVMAMVENESQHLLSELSEDTTVEKQSFLQNGWMIKWIGPTVLLCYNII